MKIDRENYKNGLINKLNTYSAKKNNKIFIFYYMEGCTPCNAVKPEWAKLHNVLSNKFLNRDDIVIVSIDKDLFRHLKHLETEPKFYPTIRYISKADNIDEIYDDSNVSNKDRSIDSFVEWIKLKTGEQNITKTEVGKEVKKTRRHKGSRKKWTRKHKSRRFSRRQ